jgi:hypothetical protein
MSHIIANAAKKLYDQLDERGIIGRVPDHGMSEEEILIVLGDYLRGFLCAEWPNVQLVENEPR